MEAVSSAVFVDASAVPADIGSEPGVEEPPNMVAIPIELNPKLGQRDPLDSFVVSLAVPGMPGTQEVQLDCRSPLTSSIGGLGFFLIPNPNPKPSDDLSGVGEAIVTLGGGRGSAFIRYRFKESGTGAVV